MTELKEEEEDRLSLLPDSLLLEIISLLHLSTKKAIKTTSVISKRWQHLWTKLPNLVFRCRDDGPARRADYFSFINNTLTQCHVNLNKFKLDIGYDSLVAKSQVFSWIRHAITRRVKVVDLFIWKINRRSIKRFSYDDELFFNNSCFMNMSLSNCVFNPPDGVISWSKLESLRIFNGRLDEYIMGKILSGSPCLETMVFNSCSFEGCLWKSLFGKFRVERLSCDMEDYELFASGNEQFWSSKKSHHMRLSRLVVNPRIGNGNGNAWGNLNFLCIRGKLDGDSIRKILSGSPFLESLELISCYGVRRIDIASISIKNLVFYGYNNFSESYIDTTLEIDAPNILSLTIEGRIHLEKILLLNISSLVKADFDYECGYIFPRELGRTSEDIEEELLKGLLTNLGHVNKMTVGDEITLGDNCLKAFSSLKKRGFPEVHSTSRKETILNSSHSNSSRSSHDRFYLLIIILLFSVWLAMVSNLLAY